MPFDIPVSGVDGEDLFPEDEEAQQKIVAWISKAYEQSRAAKANHQLRWDKFYRMYRSYVKKRAKGDWRSRAWMPIAFYVIETIIPRLVAQLPKFTVDGVREEDEQGAEYLETLLDWASDQSDLYLELAKGLKSSLIYGTGILKTTYDEKTAYSITREPEMMEQTVEMPTGEMDMDGNSIMQTMSMGAVPTGETSVVRRPYTRYAGPIAEAVDIKNFFVDPVADSIENARYVIHRVYRDRAYLEDMFEAGVYHRPEKDIWQSFLSDHAGLERMASVDLGPGSSQGDDSGLIELLEFWTDRTVATVVSNGDSASMLLRVERNPFAHGMKPFVRVVDHLVPHEFWGIGELEPLEGIQDTVNALWNSRIDNVKLVLNSMFLAVMDYVVDPADLQVRPAGVVRIREGVPLDQAVQPLELGEVTSSSYTEVAELERMTEKVSGVSPYQTGTDSASVNRTATGVALISEQGNTRFAHKVRIAELTGFRQLAMQYATIIQQFSGPEITVRLLNPEGAAMFQTIPLDAISGQYDFNIEAESSTQTESIRREQTLSLFQLLAADPYMKPLKIRADVLKTFGKKNTADYMLTEEELYQMQAAAAAQPQEEGAPVG